MTEEKPEAQTTSPFIQLMEKIIEKESREKETLKILREIFYRKDDKLADLRAIVLELHMILEESLNDIILQFVYGKDIYRDVFNFPGRLFLGDIVLEKITFADKVQILRKTKKFENRILNKIEKINSLRNSLAHYRTTPKKSTKDILWDKSEVKKVADDTIEIYRYLESAFSEEMRASLAEQLKR